MTNGIEKRNQFKKKEYRSYFTNVRFGGALLELNIGREQDGGGNQFERPIVIIKTLSPDTFVGLPLSTKKRLDKFQAKITHDKIHGFALLDQMRVLDSKGLLRKIGTANPDEFDVLIEKTRELL